MTHPPQNVAAVSINWHDYPRFPEVQGEGTSYSAATRLRMRACGRGSARRPSMVRLDLGVAPWLLEEGALARQLNAIRHIRR